MKTVDRGAAFLDEREPEWWKKIDVETLSLGSFCNCVLGQLYLAEHPKTRSSSPYHAKCKELRISPWSADLGFFTFRSYENLTTAWRRLIRKRQKASSA